MKRTDGPKKHLHRIARVQGRGRGICALYKLEDKEKRGKANETGIRYGNAIAE